MKQKKFLFIGSFMLMVAAAGAYHAYTSNSAVKDGDLLMANVEALANRAESSGGNTVDCYSSSKADKGSTYYDCGDCTKQFNSEGKGDSRTCVTK